MVNFRTAQKNWDLSKMISVTAPSPLVRCHCFLTMPITKENSARSMDPVATHTLLWEQLMFTKVLIHSYIRRLTCKKKLSSLFCHTVLHTLLLTYASILKWVACWSPLRMVAFRVLTLALLLCLQGRLIISREIMRAIFENIDHGYNRDVMPPTSRGEPVRVGITVSYTF